MSVCFSHFPKDKLEKTTVFESFGLAGVEFELGTIAVWARHAHILDVVRGANGKCSEM